MVNERNKRRRRIRPTQHCFMTFACIPLLMTSVTHAFFTSPIRQPFLLVSTRIHSTEKDGGGDNRADDENNAGLFDIRTAWQEATQDSTDFWKDIIDISPQVDAVKEQVKETFFSNNNSDNNNVLLDNVRDTMSNLLQGTQESGGALDSILSALTQNDDDKEESDTQSFFPQIISILLEYKEPIGCVLKTYLSDLDFSKLNPTSLWYYLEFEEERKNVSWKRRMHRFFPKVELEEIQDLNDKLILAGLSYADSLEDLKRGLEECSASLVFCQLDSKPAKPSHYIAIPRRQSEPLQVWMVIRGTKTLGDAVTDLCANNVDYRGGVAHDFLLQSGQYLAEMHRDLLESLREASNAPSVQLTVIGHSLGAAAAAFMALELKDTPNINVQVFGFGTPSALSKELAQDMASSMTTVISDADVVPRLNGVTLSNALLDIMEFDYRDRVERDITLAMNELQQRGTFSNETISTAMKLFDPLLDKHMELALPLTAAKRHQSELFPPGRCIHLYRDGFGISARHVPNDFFSEIDVTRRMIRDHVRFGYEQIFHDLMRVQYQDLYFMFETAKVSDFNKQKLRKATLPDDKAEHVEAEPDLEMS